MKIINFLLTSLLFVFIISAVNGISISKNGFNNTRLMGDIVNAKCGCGYSIELFVGGGMTNFRSYCGFPFYCNNCRSLFNYNYLKEEGFCTQCNSRDVLPYDNNSLREHASNNAVFSWNIDNKTLILTDDNYLCPQCGKYTLQFSNTGNWD